MSDPSNVGPGSATSQSGNVVKKPRSPVERVIVWGAIIVLLSVVAVEARARKGYEWTLSALEKELEKDEGANAQPLYVKNIGQHLIGWPKRTEADSGGYRTITLTWKGLFRSHGIDLTCEKADGKGAEPAVLSMVTHGAPEPAEPVAEASPDAAAPPSSPPPGMTGPGGSYAGGPGGAGPGGGGPGGGRFDPMQQDKDGDHKISKEEAEGRLKENFDRNDTNADGFIDEDEVAAMRERFQNRGGGAGAPGGGGINQQEVGPGGRPPSESGTTTDKPAESTSPESTPPKDGAESSATSDKTPGASTP